jgi:hypothetical protein
LQHLQDAVKEAAAALTWWDVPTLRDI